MKTIVKILANALEIIGRFLESFFLGGFIYLCIWPFLCIDIALHKNDNWLVTDKQNKVIVELLKQYFEKHETLCKHDFDDMFRH